MKEHPIYTKCKRCKRPLKNDLARTRGYGSHCWKLHITEVKKHQKTLFNLELIKSK